MVLYVATDGFVASLSSAQGFVLATDPQGNACSVTTNAGTPGTNECGMFVFWKRAVGGDTMPTIAAPVNGGTVQVCHINTYSNTRTGNPIHKATTAIVGTATTTVNPPSITTTLNGCTVFSVAASTANDSTFNSWGSTGSASPAGSLDSGFNSGIGNACMWAGGRGGFATAGGPHNCTTTFAISTRQAQITFALASLAETTVTATESVTLAPTTIAAAAGVTATASAATTLGATTVTSAVVTTTPVTASVATTLGASTVTSAAAVITGPSANLDVTLAPTAVASAGTVSVSASGAPSLGGTQIAAAGTVSLTASAAIALAPTTVSAAASQLPALRLGVVAVRQKAFGTVTGFPGAGALTTHAQIPSWTASTALTVDQGIRRVNGANVYELIGSGTTAASGGPTGTGSSIADNTCTWQFIATNSGAVDTQTSGSAILISGARGTWADPGTGPTDNKGNTYTQVDLQGYAPPFAASKQGLFVKFGATGGTGHTASLNFGNASGTSDEETVALAEAIGAALIKNVSYVEHTTPTANTVTGAPCKATAPALVFAEFWLDGVVRSAGSQHLCVPFVSSAPAGTTIAVLAMGTALTALSTNGYIQRCLAIFVPPGGAVGDPVPAGTYTAACTTNSGEGSAIRTYSVQANDGVVLDEGVTLAGTIVTSSAAVTSPRNGTVAVTLAGTGVASSASVTATGSENVTLGRTVVAAGAGVVAAGAVASTLAGSGIAASAGVVASGAVASTLAGSGVAAGAGLTVTAAGATTLAGTSVTASAGAAVTGSENATLVGSVVASSAGVTVTAASAPTLGASTVNAAASAVSGRVGTVDSTLAGTAVTSVAGVALTAVGAPSLGGSTLAASAAVTGGGTLTASVQVALSVSTVTSSASVAVTASAAATLAGSRVSASASNGTTVRHHAGTVSVIPSGGTVTVTPSGGSVIVVL